MSENQNPTKPIAIELGEFFVKIGISGEDRPRIIIDLRSDYMRKSYTNDEFYPLELLSVENKIKRITKLDFPENIDHIEDILQKGFEKTNINPKDKKLVVSIDFEFDLNQRITLANILFKKFQIARLFFGNHHLFALYSSGKTTGLLIEVGYKEITTIPVYEGLSEKEFVKIIQPKNTRYHDDRSIDEQNKTEGIINQVDELNLNENGFPTEIKKSLIDKIYNSLISFEEEKRTILADQVLFYGEQPEIKSFEQNIIQEFNEKYKDVQIRQTSPIDSPNEATWVGLSISGSITYCFTNPYISQEILNEGNMEIITMKLGL
ncbi:MAG: actin family protein [Candidatus Heimdallarchaeota archaeon]|nr:actin family protein [Candidatus Heimdallarchaeota archaeon]MDH5645924.1 actin family protein [Candidatus Heimdallarchaeota archaeon]